MSNAKDPNKCVSVQSSTAVLKAMYPSTGWTPYPYVELRGPLECRAFEWRCDVFLDSKTGIVSEDAWVNAPWWKGRDRVTFRAGDVFHVLRELGERTPTNVRVLALVHSDCSTRELVDWERFARELAP